MKTDRKILYIMRKYDLKYDYTHDCCGTSVLKSNKKEYDYYCPKCQMPLFTEEVKGTDVLRTKKDREVIKKYLSIHNMK